MESQVVKDILSALPKGETIYYRSNPGNAGDALIALGTFHLFDELGLNFQFIEPGDFDPTDKIIVYAGGGNFNHIYSQARQFIRKNHKVAKSFILLPHTITDNVDLLSELGDNVTLFARERVSYEHIVRYAPNCHCSMDHDMALNLDLARTEVEEPLPLGLAILKKLLLKAIGRADNRKLPSIKKMLAVRAYERRTKRMENAHGKFFREDVEASGVPLPDNNSDLSRIYELSTLSREIIEYTVDLLMHHLDQYETVSTDRLHICIAAALLDKPVKFFGNSYFKCRAVYEYSLKNRFPSVDWCD